MKRCAKAGEDERKSKIIKQTNLKSVPPPPWSDLQLDLVGEIKKRLYYADHLRFSGVCKKWQEAQHEKRAGDVLPWLMVIHRRCMGRISYDLYEPSTPHLGPCISDGIDLQIYFDISQLCYRTKFFYKDGWLFITLSNNEITCAYFLLISPATKKIIQFPQLNHPLLPYEKDHFFTTFSTNPTSPDCVFLALHIINNYERAISIFRHGDTEWTTTISTGGWFGVPIVEDFVFIQGVFYFLYSGGELVSYHIDSREFKFDKFESTLDLQDIHKFFELDGELVVLYVDKNCKYYIRRYDWSQEAWVPLKSLGDRSMFISSHSVYVDAINYNGVTANKIHDRSFYTSYAYSLNNGDLFRCTLPRKWNALAYNSMFSVWVEPPAKMPMMMSGGSNGPRPIEEVAQ